MSKLRASISFQNRIDEVKNIQQKKSKENIAGPIIPIIINSNEENPINLEDPTNIQEDNSEGDEEENDESRVSSNWNGLINMWEQLLMQEEEAEKQAKDDLEYDYDTDIDEFLLNRIHPTLDNEAKWDIENIFIDNLDAPFFTNENVSN